MKESHRADLLTMGWMAPHSQLPDGPLQSVTLMLNFPQANRQFYHQLCPVFFLFSLFLRWSGTGPELSEILQRGGAHAQCLAVSCWVCWVLEAHRGPWCAPLYSSAVMAQFVVIYRNKICMAVSPEDCDSTVRTLLSNRIIRKASAPRGLGGADVRDTVGYRGRLRKHKG